MMTSARGLRGVVLCAADAAWTVDNGFRFTNNTGSTVYIHYMTNSPNSGRAIFAYVIVDPSGKIMTFWETTFKYLESVIAGL